jgi:hypothetical protein
VCRVESSRASLSHGCAADSYRYPWSQPVAFQRGGSGSAALPPGETAGARPFPVQVEDISGLTRCNVTNITRGSQERDLGIHAQRMATRTCDFRVATPRPPLSVEERGACLSSPIPRCCPQLPRLAAPRKTPDPRPRFLHASPWVHRRPLAAFLLRHSRIDTDSRCRRKRGERGFLPHAA